MKFKNWGTILAVYADLWVDEPVFKQIVTQWLLSQIWDRNRAQLPPTFGLVSSHFRTPVPHPLLGFFLFL